MPAYHPVTFERHGKKHLLPPLSWAFAAEHHTAPLFPAEFVAAARFYPIVFIRDQEKLGSFALLGLRPGKNLMLDAHHRWAANYIPAVYRRYPFQLAPLKEKNEEYALCIDEASGRIADNGGTPLFDADGNRTGILENALKFASECLRHTQAGEAFCSLLNGSELLGPLRIDLKEGEKTLRLEGLLCVDDKKLGALPDADFLGLRKAGALPLIYAHLFSLANLRVLADRHKNLRKQAAAPAAPAAILPDSFKF